MLHALAAAICAVNIGYGTHPLECKAEYIHTVGGVRYESTVTQSYYAREPLMAVCSGEGCPERVTLKDLGAVVCRSEVSLFEDGFESGSTSAWASATPQSRYVQLHAPRTRTQE